MYFKTFGICLLISSLGILETNAYLFPLAARLPIPGTPSPPGSPWPLPQQWTQSLDLITIGSKSTYQYSTNIKGCRILDEAIQNRFNYETLFHDGADPDNDFPILSQIHINLAFTGEGNQCDNYPKFERNPNHESYNITVGVEGDEGRATITAFTVWGALNGLETYSQLIWENSSHYYVNTTKIFDWARYPHRGLMIDTARHYLSPDIILEVLIGMSYNKLNVLHWHIVDDQSFPFVSQRFPELSEKGAYIPGVLIYDPPTVQYVIEEAKLRGIRVILEFDTPGHTLGFGQSHPELLTPCYGDGLNPGTPNYPNHAPYEILDPTKETTFTFMKEFFTEVFQNVSQDEFLHLGMDEVYYACWNSSPEIKKFMEEKNFTDIHQVQQYYTVRHLEMIDSLGAQAIVWQDPLDFGVKLGPNVIVQVWKGNDTDPKEVYWPIHFQNALNANYSVLLSSCWYLNYINYGESWKKYYECDPVLSVPDITPEQEKLILGGEAALWAEYADNTNTIPRLFPFVSAVAERLWSAMNSSTTDDAKWRLDEHRCRMLGRGLQVQPIFNGYCSGSENRRFVPPPGTTPSTTEDPGNENGSSANLSIGFSLFLNFMVLQQVVVMYFTI